MCPACYYPIVAALMVWILSFFGLELDYANFHYGSWILMGISTLVSVGVFFLVKWVYNKFIKKTCNMKNKSCS